MPCKKCSSAPVIILPNSNIKLCSSCFIKYFEKKVFKTIKQHSLIEKNENIIVAVSGGKDSLSILYVLNKFSSRKLPIKVSALLIDEGIKNYRDETIEYAKEFCKKYKIKLQIISYKKSIGLTLDELKKKFPDTIACSMCGVLRRYLLNKSSRELKADKLATGHNLDDEAQSIVMNLFKNNVLLSSRLGPRTGVRKLPGFIPRIKPLYFLTQKEVSTYAYLHGIKPKFSECSYANDSYRFEIRDLLNNIEQKYPGTKYSIVASFMEILPLLREKYKNLNLNSCKTCNEPTSSQVCSACKLISKIKL